MASVPTEDLTLYTGVSWRARLEITDPNPDPEVPIDLSSEHAVLTVKGTFGTLTAVATCHNGYIDLFISKEATAVGHVGRGSWSLTCTYGVDNLLLYRGAVILRSPNG